MGRESRGEKAWRTNQAKFGLQFFLDALAEAREIGRTTITREERQEWGRKGMAAMRARYSPEERSRWASEANRRRWAKKREAESRDA